MNCLMYMEATVISYVFISFLYRHPAFKSQEHRFPTVYFKPVRGSSQTQNNYTSLS